MWDAEPWTYPHIKCLLLSMPMSSISLLSSPSLSCNRGLDSLVLGAVSLLLTILNIACIILMGVLVLKVSLILCILPFFPKQKSRFGFLFSQWTFILWGCYYLIYGVLKIYKGRIIFFTIFEKIPHPNPFEKLPHPKCVCSWRFFQTFTFLVLFCLRCHF